MIDPCSNGQLDPVELEKAINAVRQPMEQLILWGGEKTSPRSERMRLGDVPMLLPEAVNITKHKKRGQSFFFQVANGLQRWVKRLSIWGMCRSKLSKY